jgi:hypothetical protein
MTAPALPAVQFRVDLGRLDDHHFDITWSCPVRRHDSPSACRCGSPAATWCASSARHLSRPECRARGPTGPADPARQTPLGWSKPRGSGPLRLRYRVYAFDNSVRSAWLDGQRGFFNGTSLFLRAEGFRRAGAARLLDPGCPSGWEVATGLPGTVDGGWLRGRLRRAWSTTRSSWAPSGAAASRPAVCRTNSWWPARCPVSMASGCSPTPAASARRRSPSGTATGSRPFDRYVFLLNAVDDGYGGLEHRASTALICPPRPAAYRGTRQRFDPLGSRPATATSPCSA